MPNAQQVRNRANSMMSGFSMGQRVVVGIAALTIIVGGVIFAQWASKPSMVPLYSNLSSDDASAITTKLQSSHTAYTLTDGGGTINVPSSKVYQTRIDMAGANLPASGTSGGYSLLDKQGITTSDFLEHVDYQRAVAGELEKTIASIQGVSAASVNLNIPQTDVFTDDSQKATASVLLKTDGQKLGSTQVTSIVNLVAGAVQGLSPTDVSVTDDKGDSLAVAGQGVSGGADSDAQSQTTSALETDMNSKIQALLEPVLGPGKVSVQSTADLNWDKINQTSEVYNPNNKTLPATSESSSVEQYGSGSGNGAATGCLGVNVSTTSTACESNTSQTAAGTTATTGPYSNTTDTKDNAIDKTVTQTQNTPGGINRLSVAVLVDSSVPNTNVAQIKQLVTDAAGLQSSRGDTVTVTPMAFDKTAASSATKALDAQSKAAKSAQMMSLIKTVVTVIIILAVLALLFFTTKKRAGNYSTTPISLAELDAGMAALPSADDMMAELGPADDNSPEALERKKVDKEITGLIEKQPEEVASLLRSWLADRRS